MVQGHKVVRERQAMLARMEPVLKEGTYFFCTTDDAAIIAAVLHRSLAIVREDEGTTLVLAEDDAKMYKFDLSIPMCRIVLEVFSALEGIGLTAGVATALADDNIPCNIIAAYHHDNIFVPERMARRAIGVLADAQQKAAST